MKNYFQLRLFPVIVESANDLYPDANPPNAGVFPLTPHNADDKYRRGLKAPEERYRDFPLHPASKTGSKVAVIRPRGAQGEVPNQVGNPFRLANKINLCL